MYNKKKKKKILIVDDTKAWLFFHKEVIRQLYGNTFNVTYALSAAEALNLVRKNIDEPYDIIITDLQMESTYEPKLAGEWLVENIKNINEYSACKIIIVSAMYNIEHIAKNMQVECISKQLLIRNKLLMKFMFEKLMPYLDKL